MWREACLTWRAIVFFQPAVVPAARVGAVLLLGLGWSGWVRRGGSGTPLERLAPHPLASPGGGVLTGRHQPTQQLGIAEPANERRTEQTTYIRRCRAVQLSKQKTFIILLRTGRLARRRHMCNTHNQNNSECSSATTKAHTHGACHSCPSHPLVHT